MVDSANADQPCADCEQIAAWEATAQSDLRNAAATAEVCAADNGGSYVNCDTLASLEAYGFNKSPDVTFTSIMTTNDHWVSTSQNINVNGGSAYKYDSADGKIVPIPRSSL